MKILLVRPARIKQAINLGEFMYSEPIGLEMVYAVLEDHHEVEILDLMADNIFIEDKIIEFMPDTVGITSLCIDVNSVLELAKKIKKYNSDIITIAGGTQTFFNPEAFFNKSIDHVMKYSNKENIKKLFDTLQHKMSKSLEQSSKDELSEKSFDKKGFEFIDGVHSLLNDFKGTGVYGRNEYIVPNRASTAKYRKYYSYFGYRPAAIMATSQGCSKNCSFCLRWRLEGADESYFDFEQVKNEIKTIQEDTIMIFDNDFLHSSQRIEMLCDYLENSGIKKNFICYASVGSILDNKPSVRRFTKLGLKAVLVGYESFSERELGTYKKGTGSMDNKLCSEFTKSIGLDVWASFIFHPDWNNQDFKSFRKYLKLIDPEISTFSPLTPFPNLPLYNEYKDRLIVKKEDYEKWSFGELTIRPLNMSQRSYYYQMLITIIYVNVVRNNIFYIVKKFGAGTLVRMVKGSMRLFFKYIKLMLDKEYKADA